MGIEILIQKVEIMKCDYCEIQMEFDTVELKFGYGSDFDCSSLIFCSDKCLRDWCIKRIK